MKILIDTNIFIWCLTGSQRLTKKILNKLNEADTIYLSSISITEMVIKIQIGKLKLDIDKAVKNIPIIGLKELPYTVSHAVTLNKLPLIHKDPFDRMLIAQALNE